MKILHLNLLQKKIVGVNKKLESIASAVKKNSLDIDVIVINLEVDDTINGVRYVKLPTDVFLSTIKRKFFRYNLFDKVIDFDKYDKIILRWSGLDFSTPLFLEKYGDKIVSEHHANELAQFKENINSVSSYFSYLMTRLMYKRFLNSVSGIIGVTPEITKSHLLHNNIPNITITNGVSVENVTFTKFKRFDNKTLYVSFIVSSYSLWHGLDRFLNGLKKYHGDINIVLNIAGNFDSSKKEEVMSFEKKNIKIIFKGMCDDKQLDEMLSDSNLAISTLAFFRAGIRYGCPIKSREYMARGIPFIYSYHDVDIDGKDKFAMKFNDDESPIDIESVIKFSIKVSRDNDISQKMRCLSIEKLSWDNKVLEIDNFMKKSYQL
jgi:hypothetical protein